MNPEVEEDSVVRPQAACSPTRSVGANSFAPGGATHSSMAMSTASSIRKSQVFQRRLKEKISESRALELLDRRIKGDRVAVAEVALGDSNQDQDDELVCDSTMVRFEATPEEHPEPRACGVLKTVRGIHRQRERDRTPAAEQVRDLGARENQ